MQGNYDKCCIVWKLVTHYSWGQAPWRCQQPKVDATFWNIFRLMSASVQRRHLAVKNQTNKQKKKKRGTDDNYVREKDDALEQDNSMNVKIT